MKNSEAQLRLGMVASWEFDNYCSVVTALPPALMRYQGSVSIRAVIDWERVMLGFCGHLLFPLSSFCNCADIYFWGMLWTSSPHDPSPSLLMSSFTFLTLLSWVTFPSSACGMRLSFPDSRPNTSCPCLVSSAAVMGTITKSYLGRKGFVWLMHLHHRLQGKSGQEQRQKPQRKAVYWLAQLLFLSGYQPSVAMPSHTN